MKNNLMQIALGTKVNMAKKKPDSDLAEVALAYAKGELTGPQAVAAFKAAGIDATGPNIHQRAASTIVTGIRTGVIKAEMA